MRLEQRLDKAIKEELRIKMQELRQLRRLEKKFKAVEEGGEDRAFWKEGCHTYRVASNIIRRTKKEVA